MTVGENPGNWDLVCRNVNSIVLTTVSVLVLQSYYGEATCRHWGELGMLWKSSSIGLKLFRNKVFKNRVFFLMRIKGGTAFHILGPHKLILPDCLIFPKFFTAPVTQAKNLGHP